MPKNKKIKSDEIPGAIIGLLAATVFLGLRYIISEGYKLFKFLLYWTWRILFFTVTSLIEYFQRRAIKRKMAVVSNQETTPENSKAPNGDQRLDTLYFDYYPKLIDSIRLINGFDRKLSYPLLISPFDNYFKATTKIMFIGKETRYWILNDQDRFLKDTTNFNQDIHHLLLNYQHFNYGEKYVKSPFWQFCHLFYKEVTSASNNDGFIWNNLSKVDENGTTPKWDATKASTAFYPIIQSEITILKPDVVIFLTGSTLDPYLKYLFNGLRFVKINDLFSKVEQNDLPNCSYRTSHPKKHRLNRTFEKVIKDMVCQIEKDKLSIAFL